VGFGFTQVNMTAIPAPWSPGLALPSSIPSPEKTLTLL
jgi:hypothetical protein